MAKIKSISTASDYFTPSGLRTKTGMESDNWDFVIIKELIDNSLDEIEPNNPKQIDVEYFDRTLGIFDNGKGISIEDLKNHIYRFDDYSSSKKEIIWATRGKMGNALPTVIGICHVNKYGIRWHTSDGVILTVKLDEDFPWKNTPIFIEGESTDKNGIEIIGIDYSDNDLNRYVCTFSDCNLDVNFTIVGDDLDDEYSAENDPVDKSPQKACIEFYNQQQFLSLLEDNKEESYKTFISEFFGPHIARKSTIDGKPRICNMSRDDKINDFVKLRGELKNRHYDMFKNNLMNWENSKSFRAEIADNNGFKFPCIIEFKIERLSKTASYPQICVYVNNSITYKGGFGIQFKQASYQITNTRQEECVNLFGLLNYYKDYLFTFHFISPNFEYMDTGKATISGTDFITKLVDQLRPALSNEHKLTTSTKRINAKERQKKAMKYMTEAFMFMSGNATSEVIVRQLFYKVRELINDPNWDEGGKTTYNKFTQEWVTDWIIMNPQYEHQIHFSDRGNFYLDGNRMGIGSANVAEFINNEADKTNKFQMYGGLQDDLKISGHFGIEYKYNKCIYVEKTGLDQVFLHAGLSKKYNAIIVSGQGFASRSAKKLLHFCQQRNLTLYCVHDLDLSGLDILAAIRKENKRFDKPIEIKDLGVKPSDVIKYKIKPETVKTKKNIKKAMTKLTAEQKSFFSPYGNYVKRVELSAFTTPQILEIIDSELKGEGELPVFNLKESLKIDHDALIETALARIIRKQYESSLAGLNIVCDLSAFDILVTLPEAINKMSEIKENFVNQYIDAINQCISNGAN